MTGRRILIVAGLVLFILAIILIVRNWGRQTAVEPQKEVESFQTVETGEPSEKSQVYSVIVTDTAVATTGEGSLWVFNYMVNGGGLAFFTNAFNSAITTYAECIDPTVESPPKWTNYIEDQNGVLTPYNTSGKFQRFQIK